MADGRTYAAWSPETGSGGGEALFLSHLRAAARAAPHSDMAIFYERMSLLNTQTSSAASTRGKFVMWSQLLSLVDAYTSDTLNSDGFAKSYARSAIRLHHPMRTIDPAGQMFTTQKGKYTDVTGVEVPAWRQLAAPAPGEQDGDWFVKTLSCPTNSATSSCFADSLFVLMFAATDKFDPLLLVEFEEEPLGIFGDEGEYGIYNAFKSPTWDESGKPGDEGKFNATRNETRRRTYLAVRDAARRVAWGIRPNADASRASGELVTNAVVAFRDALQSYAPAWRVNASTNSWEIDPTQNWATRQESARDVFEILREQSVLKKRYEILTLQVQRQDDGRVLVDVSGSADVLPTSREAWLRGEETTLQEVIDKSFGAALPDNGGIQYLCEPPASGTLMIQMQKVVPATNSDTTIAPLFPALVLPDDRQVTFTFGIPLTRHSIQRIAYRIVGVLIHSGGSPRGGHYTCYFWRGDAMYLYNDMRDPAVPQRIPEDQLSDAHRDVAGMGVLMFLERV